MTRNHLLKLSLQPRRSPSVWRMAMDVLGQAFGAGPRADRERGR